MPSLKSLKLRIKSIKSTQKITKAMKMVAASKLKRARDKAESVQPYAMHMLNMIKALVKSVEQDSDNKAPLLVGSGMDAVHLVAVITSDRGLCGGFNSSLIKAARKKIELLTNSGKNVKLLVIGRKGYELLKKNYSNIIIANYQEIGNKGLSFTDTSLIVEKIFELFEKKKSITVM